MPKPAPKQTAMGLDSTTASEVCHYIATLATITCMPDGPYCILPFVSNLEVILQAQYFVALIAQSKPQAKCT